LKDPLRVPCATPANGVVCHRHVKDGRDTLGAVKKWGKGGSKVPGGELTSVTVHTSGYALYSCVIKRIPNISERKGIWKNIYVSLHFFVDFLRLKIIDPG
jgi:hypothetical protein